MSAQYCKFIADLDPTNIPTSSPAITPNSVQYLPISVFPPTFLPSSPFPYTTSRFPQLQFGAYS